MPTYDYYCVSSAHPDKIIEVDHFALISNGPPVMYCPECHNKMARDYSTVHLAPVTHEYYSASLGRMISSQKQVNGSLTEIEDKEEAATGYRPKLVARHHSEVPNIKQDEGSLRAIHDGKVKRGEMDATDKLH
jgi:predicted nucleic acid-binding Zn ribbon protein